ncbi:MAG: glucuronate isomerase [Treponema sp.]|nr:glucuronate isomerase [Treponema sp.]
MAKDFMDENFLLETETARLLYCNAAQNEPIYDYHCHLMPSQIAHNKQFTDISEAWLSGDHYKWRVMRAMGYDEYYITGNAPSYEKFLAWAKTVENLIGNPLHHWTHLELQRYFNIYETLTEKSAPVIWEKANALLQEPQLSVKGIFEKFNVCAAGTTDDPADTLVYHHAISEGTAPIGKISTMVIPSFRPDKALNINNKDFAAYIETLSASSGISIKNTDDVLSALDKRLDFFISLHCRASDHALEYAPFVPANDGHIEKIFSDALSGKEISKEDTDAYKTKMLIELAKIYAKNDIVMQLHLASVRNVNARMFRNLGPDTGYDAVHDREESANLINLLSCMESSSEKPALPKTILYTLNPKDYYPLATISGGFQDNYSKEENRQSITGKMQLGASWWFCDHRDGMEEQMRVLANTGMLSVFIGMLTDSRSFLSYPRHEYFRRILCNLIGRWVENGEYPKDMEKLEKIVRDISFGNAERYFG